LIVSLCVNLVLAGVIATAVARFTWHAPVISAVQQPAGMRPPGGPGGPGGGPMDRVQVRQILSPRVLMAIAPQKIDAIRTVMRAHRDRVMALRDEAMAARQAVHDIYGTPQIDKQALARAIARLQTADAALAREAASVAVEAAPLLSQDERRKILATSPHSFGPHNIGMGGGGRHHEGHGPDDNQHR
jgi:uncharacterized membrane protein